MKFAWASVLLFFQIVLTHVSLAQDRPKVGLVLSGGGAKGIAHIGVLKALEESGIRPDYIAGTSMGAIVGGLYAIGYSADEIEKMIGDVDWGLVLSNQVPLNYISFEEKEYFNRFMLEFPVEDLSVKLPSGLIEGQMLSEMIQHYCWPSYNYNHFDEFPIPFRCVATDVKTGLPVVFEDGPLPLALRSSMALPSAFTAVAVDSTLLVDGGVTNNFPVDIVEEMGAEIIIGVNVSTTLEEELPSSIADILMSLAMIPSTAKLKEQIERCDIYIEPDMSLYSTGSFSKGGEILEMGLLAGHAHKEQFNALKKQLGVEKPISIKALEVKSYRIDELTVENNELFSEELIKSKLGYEPGDTLNREELDEGIRRVYGINGFNKVTYNLNLDAENACDIELELDEKPKSRIATSLHVDNVFAAGLVLNFQSRDLLGKESRTIIAADISKNPRFRTDYYKYFGIKKSLALNFRYDFFNEQLPVYDNGELQDVRQDRAHILSARVLTTQSLNQSFSLGFNTEFRRTRSKYDIASREEIERIDERLSYIEFSYLRNRLDNRNFPTHGVDALALVRFYVNSSFEVTVPDDADEIFQEAVNFIEDELAPEPYLSILLRGTWFVPLTNKTQLVPYAALASSLGNSRELSFVDDWYVGGYQQVTIDDNPAYGLNYAELQTPNFAVGGLRIQHVLFNKLFVNYGANYITSHDYVPLEQASDAYALRELEENSLLGYGIDVSLKSPLGPISAGMSSNTEDGSFRYFFSFGFSMNYSD